MKLAALRCCVCGDAESFAVHPGRTPLRAAGIVILRGAADTAWCEPCWRTLFGAREVA